MNLLGPLPYNRGLDFAQHIPEWGLLCQELTSISSKEIEDRHTAGGGKKKGAQPSLNAVVAERLVAGGFDSGPYVFPTKKLAKERGNTYVKLPQLQLDFKKGHLGVEVQFNNAASLEHTIFKLNTAFAHPSVLPEDLILVGVLILASKRLKTWGSMDSTVRAFESAEDKLDLLRSSMAVPLLVVGLDAGGGWPVVSPSFPGTGRGGGKGS